MPVKKILIVKTTSMGDLLQLFPALTDADRCFPGIKFDWVVEESFQEIPRLHPTINKIIAISYRKWKNNFTIDLINGAIKQSLQELRRHTYDMIIDAQSNLKSALISKCARGTTYGLDWRSVREYGANFAYQHKIHVARDQNHAERMRQLMAKFLGYPLQRCIADYGIDKNILPSLDFNLPAAFIFVTPISSRKTQTWPESFWKDVLNDIVATGYSVVLPWWSDHEKHLVLRLKNNNIHIQVLPPLTLSQKATVLSRAKASISLDTGLAHMAAALEIPNVSLYGPTNATLTGTVGFGQIHLSATSPACAPCLRTKCNYTGDSFHNPACFASIKPQQVLESLYSLIHE